MNIPELVNSWLPCDANVAVTSIVAVTGIIMLSTTHVLVPLHAPVQPTNVPPASGVAVSVTIEFSGKPCVHVVPQFMPAGEDVTVPVPSTITEILAPRS